MHSESWDFLETVSYIMDSDRAQWKGENYSTDHLYNPNTFVGLVGKVRKNSPEGGRKGGWRKKKHAQRARWAQGSNPGPAAC